MWNRSARLEDRDALHVLALLGTGQQDRRRQAPVVENAALPEPGGGSVTIGRHNHRTETLLWVPSIAVFQLGSESRRR